MIPNAFTIYPAIDIRDGKCVRLYQGDYNKETIYGTDPVSVAKQWVDGGASWLHLVDLDGAKAGRPVNDRVISDITKSSVVPVQVGGGIRSMSDVERLLEVGVSRLILGTAAIRDQAFVKEALHRYGNKIAIGIDARDGFVATEGWLETSTVKAEALAKTLVELGATTFIYTDISRDGTLTGPNTEAILSLVQSSKASVIASGGVSSLQDLQKLARYTSEGISGAIVGKALYDKRFTLREALSKLRSEVL